MRELTDGELLRAFIDADDQQAFAALMQRHGGMVLAAARAVVQETALAEDVAQATFLTLARKARTLIHNRSLANWLYYVAVCLARDTRRQEQRRREREKEAAMIASATTGTVALSAEAQAALHEEIARLSATYRAPILLHHLQGKSYEEAASALNCKPKTFSARLTRAREKLRKRLAGRGVTLGAGALVAALDGSASAAELPAAVVASTCQAASCLAAGKTLTGGVVSAKVMALMKGALKMMFWHKVKVITGGVICAAVIAIGSVYAAQGKDEPAREPAPVTPVKTFTQTPVLPGTLLLHAVTAPLDKTFASIDQGLAKSLRSTALAASLQPGSLKMLFLMGAGLPVGTIDTTRELHAFAWCLADGQPAVVLLLPTRNLDQAMAELVKAGAAKPLDQAAGYVMSEAMSVVKPGLDERCVVPLGADRTALVLYGGVAAAREIGSTFDTEEVKAYLAKTTCTGNTVLQLTPDIVHMQCLSPAAIKQLAPRFAALTAQLSALTGNSISITQNAGDGDSSKPDYLSETELKLQKLRAYMATFEGNTTFKLVLNDDEMQLVQETAPFAGSEWAAIAKEFDQANDDYPLALGLPRENLGLVAGVKMSPAWRKSFWRGAELTALASLGEGLADNGEIAAGAIYLDNDTQTGIVDIRSVMLLQTKDPADFQQKLLSAPPAVTGEIHASIEHDNLRPTTVEADDSLSGMIANVLREQLAATHGNTVIFAEPKSFGEQLNPGTVAQQATISSQPQIRKTLAALGPRQMAFMIIPMEAHFKQATIDAKAGRTTGPKAMLVATLYAEEKDACAGIAMGTENGRMQMTIAVPYGLFRFLIGCGIQGPYQQVQKVRQQISEIF